MPIIICISPNKKAEISVTLPLNSNNSFTPQRIGLNTYKTIEYILILLGGVLLYFRRRNRFNRRNIAGVEEFKSFEYAVGNRLLEMVMKIIAYLLILVGIVFVFKNKSHSDKVSTQTEINSSKK